MDVQARFPLIRTKKGIWCREGDFFIDPSRSVERAIITHAHSDHARPGSGIYYCVNTSVGLLQKRLGKKARIEGVPYGRKFEVGGVTLSFHSAGHILGSAQVRMELSGEVWVVSGDYKRDDDASCEPFEVVPCDAFITEATFGLPIYRWEPTAKIVREIHEWWESNRAEGIASILFCYSLGKAQRVLAELAKHTDRKVYVHSATHEMSECYRAEGVKLVPTEPIPDEISELSGQLILTPPGSTGKWMKKIGPYQTAFASGWMNVRSIRKSRGYDRGFVMSDHADWPGLLKTIRETGARKVFVTHGECETLARYLRETGLPGALPISVLNGEVPEPK